MADEMKELRGAVFDLIPDGVSVVALDEIEVDDMAPKTRNVIYPAHAGINRRYSQWPTK